MYDLIIKNGTIVDGTGNAPYLADVAMQNGKIARIASGIADGKTVIDATGLTVTPGFIDSHSHSDNSVLAFPDQIEKIEQGITTSIGGQCGNSVAPAGDNADVCKTMGTFLTHAKQIPLGSNLATFVGHSALRNTVMGPYDRAPTQQELEAMGELLKEGIAHGALGISFGLIYNPGCFARTEELIYLAKIAAQEGGLVATHIRDEGYHLLEACEEFLTVIKASGARAIFSHHKAMYRENWGKVNQSLAMIDKANREGCDIYCDVYPYTASHSSLAARFIPKQYRSGGNPAVVKNLTDPEIREQIRQDILKKFGDDPLDWVLLTICPNTPEYAGLRLNEIARCRGKDVVETIFDIIIENNNTCRACFFLMCEEDLETVLAHPKAMLCTDATVRGTGQVYHPRLRGSFPRALGRYVRERAVVSLPEMIRKMTSLPASVYGLAGKGILREGYDADICIFDAQTILDRAEYTDCHRRAEGLRYVLLNGMIVAENGVYNGTRAGKILI